MPGFLPSVIGALRDASKYRQERVADSSQNHHDKRQTRILNYPRTVIFRKCAIEKLVHRFDGPMPPNCGEPMLGCHPVDSETGDVIESFSIRLAKTIECVGVDTNKRSEVLPAMGGATTTWSEFIAAELPPLFDGLK